MGRMCAWCGTVVQQTAVSDRLVTHTLCGGCLEDLRDALESTGLHLEEPRASGEAR